MEHATPEGTEEYAADADLAEVGYTTLGRTGLVVSRLGFGTYRVDDRAPEHQEALTYALLQGVNLIDTSTNYVDGHGELAVGAVIEKLVDAGKLRRDQVVVVTKAGYVQGQNLAVAKEREAAGEPFPEVVHYQEGLWHCLHPAFLNDQLGRSLDRLKLSAVDVLLLHNPEYFLVDAAEHRKGTPRAEVRDEFYVRLRRAFEHLEAEHDAGRLSWYGVSSNTLGLSPDRADATSLTRMLQVAREAAAARRGDPASHRFAVAQAPMNLFEPQPATVRKDGDGGTRTMLEHAAAEGVAVLVNRPLNAISHERLVRLAEPAPLRARQPLAEAADEVAAIEAVFRDDFAPRVRVEGKGPRPEELFRWGVELADAPTKIAGLDQWMQLQSQIIGPNVNAALSALQKGFTGDVAFAAWAKRYAESLSGLLESVSAELVARARASAEKLKARTLVAAPEPWRAAPLSRVAIATLLSEPGVTSVLVGMRRKPYVDDAIAAVGLPPLPPGGTAGMFEAFAKEAPASAR